MDSISTRLVISENQVIEKEDLSITLSKVTSSDLSELVVGEGSAQFKMPANINLNTVGDIVAKVINVMYENYRWPLSMVVQLCYYCLLANHVKPRGQFCRSNMAFALRVCNNNTIDLRSLQLNDPKYHHFFA